MAPPRSLYPIGTGRTFSLRSEGRVGYGLRTMSWQGLSHRSPSFRSAMRAALQPKQED